MWLWNVAQSSAAALAHLVRLHGHECWGCGRRVDPGRVTEYELLGQVWPPHLADRTAAELDEIRPWRGPWCTWPPPPLGPPEPVEVLLEVEHVRPLWLLTSDEATELRWWLPFNLQLLCSTCHGAKTRSEARLRARIRRDNPGRLR